MNKKKKTATYARPKAKIVEHGWMIVNPSGRSTLGQCYASERTAKMMIDCPGTTWAHLEQKGYRCVRVEIREVTE